MTKPRNPLSPVLPKVFGDTTINDLMSDDIEFTKKGNKVTMRRQNDFGTSTAEMEISESGRTTIIQSSVPHQEKKADYLEDIIEMKKRGISQKDIAFRLKLSESYVSKSLKKAGYKKGK